MFLYLIFFSQVVIDLFKTETITGNKELPTAAQVKTVFDYQTVFTNNIMNTYATEEINRECTQPHRGGKINIPSRLTRRKLRVVPTNNQMMRATNIRNRFLESKTRMNTPMNVVSQQKKQVPKPEQEQPATFNPTKIHSEVLSSYFEVECIILIYRCIDIMICN